MPTWINSDGLPINFGIDEAELGKVASYRTDGDERYTEIVVEAEYLPAFGVTEIIDYNCALPLGAVILRVEVAANTETFVGAGATLDIGTVNKDGATAGVVDSIADGLTIANLNAGTVAAQGSLAQGAPLAAAKLLTWTVNTADITAGSVALRVFWSVPKHGDQTDTLVYVKP